MLFMTAKVDKKKIAIILAAIAVALIILMSLFSGGSEATPTAAPTASTNDARVKFLTDFGWQVNTSPTQTSQVRIPTDAGEVFTRYNTLQQSQGYDLSQYAGKTVMRYVYQITNYPGATEPVYATLLVYKNQIIGGDVTNTAAGGQIRGFKMPTDLVSPSTAPSSEASS